MIISMFQTKNNRGLMLPSIIYIYLLRYILENDSFIYNDILLQLIRLFNLILWPVRLIIQLRYINKRESFILLRYIGSRDSFIHFDLSNYLILLPGMIYYYNRIIIFGIVISQYIHRYL